MTEARRLHCAEIWGGIALADTNVCTRGISASSLSSPCGSDTGGGLHYFSVCSSDLLTRIAIADMRGHGSGASPLSSALYGPLQRRMNTLDGSGVLEDLNKEVHSRGFQALTTAAVLGYYVATGKMHPPVLFRDRASGWRPSSLNQESPGANLPLGVTQRTRYDQDEIEIRSGDRRLWSSIARSCEAKYQTMPPMPASSNTKLMTLQTSAWPVCALTISGSDGQFCV